MNSHKIAQQLVHMAKGLLRDAAWPTKVEEGGLRKAMGLDEDKPLEDQASPSDVVSFFEGSDKEGRGMVMFAVNSNQDSSFWKKVGAAISKGSISSRNFEGASGIKKTYLKSHSGEYLINFAQVLAKSGESVSVSDIQGAVRSFQSSVKKEFRSLSSLSFSADWDEVVITCERSGMEAIAAVTVMPEWGADFESELESLGFREFRA